MQAAACPSVDGPSMYRKSQSAGIDIGIVPIAIRIHAFDELRLVAVDVRTRERVVDQPAPLSAFFEAHQGGVRPLGVAREDRCAHA